MDTQTGQILAMSSLVNKSEPDPSLTQQNVWPTPTGIPGVYESQNNLAVTTTYEPGSVFKIVPFSEGLNDGVITPTSRFAVPDYVTFDGHDFHDAEQHGLEHLTATQILEYSSNIGTYEITQPARRRPAPLGDPAARVRPADAGWASRASRRASSSTPMSSRRPTSPRCRSARWTP